MTEDLARHSRAAAQAIAGNTEPTDWLLNAVQKMADELSYTIRADARVPLRVELRQQLAGIRDASKLISVLLFPFMHGGKASLLLLDHFLQEGERRLTYEADLHRYLENIAERCEYALGNITAGGGQNRGISKEIHDRTSSADIICALSVQTLWKHVHGRRPGLRNERAHQACSELWLAAGGEGTKMAGWRVDMEKSRTKRYAHDGTTLAKQVGVQGIHFEFETP